MSELHIPWLELAVAIPLFGAAWISLLSNPVQARRHSLVVSGAVLICAVFAWQDFALLGTDEAHDHWDLLAGLFGAEVLVIDNLNAPLLPLAALLFFLTQLSTLASKLQRFSFSRALLSEAILLATLALRQPWLLIALLAIGILPVWWELRVKRRPTRVFGLHMGLFVILMVVGQVLMDLGTGGGFVSVFGSILLMAAVLMRCGIAPVHCWMADLFEKASFGTAILFVTPMVGAYAAMRLVFPVAPEWALDSIALLSLITAVYAAGMALVQVDPRRFFCYLFLSNSSLVLVGMELATLIGMTGSLCVWLSVSLALTGFGLTLRSVESRIGRFSLSEYHGLFDHAPMLAAFFLLTGLASIGFPGTIGFVAVELLIDGAIQASPIVGTLAVLAAALNGLAVMFVFFRVFTGRRRDSSIDMRCRLSERLAVLVLTVLILGGGLFPQPGVLSRYEAAKELLTIRQQRYPEVPETADDRTWLDSVEPQAADAFPNDSAHSSIQ